MAVAECGRILPLVTATVYKARGTFFVAGEVTDIASAHLISMQSSIATLLGVNAADVSISVSAGSALIR